MKKLLLFLMTLSGCVSGPLAHATITLPPVPPMITSSNFYTCGTNRYVNASTGSDSYDGTSATYVSGTTGPWQTLGGAITGLIGTTPANLTRSGYCVTFAAGTYIGDVADTPTTPWYNGSFIGYTTHGGYLGLGGTSGTSNQLVFKCASYQACTMQMPYTTVTATGFEAIMSFGKLNQYTFGTGSNVSMVVGDTYTTATSGATCTILSTTSSSETFYASCNGTPDPASAALTQVSGTGPGSVNYTSVSGGWLGGNIVVDGFKMEGIGGIWWTVTGSPTASLNDVYKDAGGNLYTVEIGTATTGSTTLWTTASANPVQTVSTSTSVTANAGAIYTAYNNADAIKITCTMVNAVNSSTSFLMNCTGTPGTANQLVLSAGSTGTSPITVNSYSNSSGALTWVSGSGGSSSTINYTAKSGSQDAGITTAGSGLYPMSNLTVINTIMNGFGAGGGLGNHLDHSIVEGDLVTNNTYSGSGQYNGMSIYNNFQSDNSNSYHNIIEWNVMYGNAEGPYIAGGYNGGHTDGEGFIEDDAKNTQNKCSTDPTVTIVTSGGAIESGTATGGVSCGTGQILYVTQSGAYGGAFITTSGGSTPGLELYTAGTGYSNASGLATTSAYGKSEGQGGTASITTNAAGQITACNVMGGSPAGYVAGTVGQNNGNIFLVVYSGASSGECQVTGVSAGVPTTLAVYNPGKGYPASATTTGLTIVNLADKLTLVENNLVFNNGGSGIRIYDSDGAVVISNTSNNNDTDPYGNITIGYSAGIMLSSSSGDVMVNNISVATVGTGAQAANTAYSDLAGGGSCSGGYNCGNIYFNNLSYNGTPGSASFYVNNSDMASTTLTGSPYNNYLGINPTFNNPSNDDFSLGAAFPSQDGGISTFGYPVTDLVGNSVNSSSIDLGAYQFVTNAATIVGNTYF